jgi:peptide/nickel transport system permease protein
MSATRLLGLVLVGSWLLIALIGPALAPHAVGAIVADDALAPASAALPFGSDYLGRDVLSRMLHGARYTVGLALAGALFASTAGTLLALLATAAGRWLDEVLSRLFDALIAIPSKIFALVLVAGFGSSIPLLLLTVALTYMPGAFRVARSLAVNQNAMDYVLAARARGEGTLYIAWREILPNIIVPIATDFGLRFMFVVLLLSGLSFLGLGVQPPDADLGSLVRENISGLAYGAPAVLAPAIAIATLTLGMNLYIDSLSRDARGNAHDR